jgi:oligopeptide transport system substrate-binding protein
MERRIDLNTNQRRAVVVLAVLGFLLVTGIIYLDKRAAYTANLDQRTFNLALVGTIDSLAPALLDSHPEKVLAAAMYEGLVYYDEESKSIKPLLASDWRYSSDGKSLTLNLKRKISFHNGKRIEAQDVKRAWENSFSTTKEWANISLFLSIQGSQERLDGKSAEINGIQVIDAGTIRIQFNQPNAAFIYSCLPILFSGYTILKTR